MSVEFKEFSRLKYILKYPKNYSEGKRYPVILFLHGAGTRGDNLEMLLDNPFFTVTDKYDEFPFVILAPQCSKNTWFDLFCDLIELTKEIPKMPFADAKHIYVMGASMGGYATWQLAMSEPEYFAAAVPLCGGGMYWNAPRLRNTPIWAFHGGKDGVVFPEESQKMVNAVNSNGGNARLTVYPENFHDCWNATYSNYQVFEWLLEQENKNDIVLEDTFRDSKIYG